jgi:hypothetical protein
MVFTECQDSTLVKDRLCRVSRLDTRQRRGLCLVSIRGPIATERPVFGTRKAKFSMCFLFAECFSRVAVYALVTKYILVNILVKAPKAKKCLPVVFCFVVGASWLGPGCIGFRLGKYFS